MYTVSSCHSILSVGSVSLIYRLQSLSRLYVEIWGCAWAAAALASMVTKEDLARKQLYPSLPQIREISAKIATAVAEIAYEQGMIFNRPFWC